MRWFRAGGVRRNSLLFLIIITTWSFAVWYWLPYDNPILLFVRFASHHILILLPGHFGSVRDDTLFRASKFPVDLDHDVAFVTKTGYGTQFRVAVQLDALGFTARVGYDHNILVIADFDAQIKLNDADIEIHDVVRRVVASKAVTGLGHLSRLQKYVNMSAAIRSGSRERAIAVSKEVGWELDALKFIPGLELAHHKMPGRKWYVLFDDDSYILKPSLRLMLGQLDPARPIYVGNPVGDFKGRFAHGGSSIILSGAAMDLLFERNPALVAEAYVNSIEEIWGDRLVATTFMKVGVYLDERYTRYFNGERPRITRISADRFCSPIVSFHGLADAQLTREVSDTFGQLEEPVLWGELWSLYGGPDFSVLKGDSGWLGRDYVGRIDKSTETTLGVGSVAKCAGICTKRKANCLAWKWDEQTEACYNSPWMIVGEERTELLYSSINVAQATKLLNQCGGKG